MFSFHQVFLLTEEPTKLDTALGLLRVVSTVRLGDGVQHVSAFAGPCPGRGNIVPPVEIILNGHPTVKAGDVLIPGSSVKGYELLGLLRPGLRHATPTENAQYAACRWPADMMQP
jgi:hypothetical protein